MKKLLTWILVLMLLCGCGAMAAPLATESDLDAGVEEQWIPSGYVSARPGTVVYEDAQLQRKLGMLTANAIVYAWHTAGDNAVAVSFAVNGRVQEGYVAMDRLSELPYVFQPAADATLRGVALLNVAFQYAVQPTQAPREEEPEQEPETPDAPQSPVNGGSEVATGTDLDPATPTDLDPATATDLDAARDDFFTLADQVEAKAVKLSWNKVPGAYGYIVSYMQSGKLKTVKLIKTEQKVTLLPMGDYTFYVQAYSDRLYKNPLGEQHAVNVTVADWTWAKAPASVTVTVPDPTEAVIQVSYVAGAAGADGFEISDNKKLILAEIDGAPQTRLYTVTNGVHSIYARPYRYLSDGSKVYGAYVVKFGKATIKIDWMTQKPKLTLTQTGMNQVNLSWTIVSGVDGYVVYEVVNKVAVPVAETDRSGHVTLDDVSLGKHTYYVQPYRVNSLGAKAMGSVSLNVIITTKDNWWYTAKLTVKALQVDEDQVKLTWNTVPGVDGFIVSEYNGTKKLGDIATLPGDAVEYTVEDVTIGRHTYAVTPYYGSTMGKTVKAPLLTTKVLWNIAPKLTFIQTSETSIRLNITASGKPKGGFRVEYYDSVTKKYELLTVTDSTSIEITTEQVPDLTKPKTAKFKACPVDENGNLGKYSLILSAKLGDGWKLVYDVHVEQISPDSAYLWFTSVATPDAYTIYRKNGVKTTSEIRTPDQLVAANTPNTYGYLITDLQEDELLNMWVIPGKWNATRTRLTAGTKSAVVNFSMAWYDPFVIEDGVLVSYLGRDAQVTIPEGVTAIGPDAFKGNAYVQTVDLGDRVTSIGAGAFSGCTALRSVTGTAALTSVGSQAFTGTNLDNYDFLDGVKDVASDVLPDPGTEWKSKTYTLTAASTGFGTVTVSWIEPDTSVMFLVADPSTGTFPKPTAVKPSHTVSVDLTAASENEEITVKVRAYRRGADGKWQYGETSQLSLVLSKSEYTQDDVVYQLTDGSVVLKQYKGSASQVTIPESVGGYIVTKVGEKAFQNNTALQSIDLPDTIQVFGAQCFAGCTNLSEMK